MTNNNTKTLHRRQKLSKTNSTKNWDAPEGFAVPAPLVTPVVLLFNDTNTIWYGNRVRHQYT